MTRGIISAKDRSLSTPTETLDHLIQTDAAINHGNSGGPLINANGEVVGINTAIFENAQSIGFSIAIDSVKTLIKDLKNGKGAVAPDEAFLGVQTVDVDSPDLDQAVKDQFGVTAAHGAFITQVTPNTAAEDAGLQEGDVIVEIDGDDVATAQDVSDIIGNHKSAIGSPSPSSATGAVAASMSPCASAAASAALTRPSRHETVVGDRPPRIGRRIVVCTGALMSYSDPVVNQGPPRGHAARGVPRAGGAPLGRAGRLRRPGDDRRVPGPGDGPSATRTAARSPVPAKS